MRSNILLTAVILIGATAYAHADLLDFFSGYTTVVNEVGVSGLTSSYHGDTKAGNPISGGVIGNGLAILGPDRVTYPSGVGQVPSPGGAMGKNFDNGMLGFKIDSDELIVRFAGGLDPTAGYYHSGWKTWYSQGDMFLSVEDTVGVSHYALLTGWARGADGSTIKLNGGHFDTAETFHTMGGPGGTSLEGHLVRLTTDSDVTLVGGTGSYHAGKAPAGLDIRTFAAGGIDLGSADLNQVSVQDFGQTWFVQTWTVALGDLSDAPVFDIGLHTAASCGNDQIAAVATVPEPSSLFLALAGFALVLRRRR
jgi:hypothetical protein